jgi:2-C-methyl-D-erythritol 2,4-cyclodiphosphate synthase
MAESTEATAVSDYLRHHLLDLVPRSGIGYDVHPFAEGRKLVLGGVDIPAPAGLQGHSDADAATHAIVDALLGAAALGDIGHFFPDSDARYKGMSSLEMLRIVRERLASEGYSVVSVDATIIAERPRLAPFVAEMRANLAHTLAIDLNRVSLKATTHEKMGCLGRGEGLAALAIASIVRLPA